MNYDTWKTTEPVSRLDGIEEQLDAKCRFYKKNALHPPVCGSCGNKYVFDSTGYLLASCSCGAVNGDDIRCESCDAPMTQDAELDVERYAESLSDGSDIY